MASQPASGILRLIGAHDPVCELADADLLARFHAQREQRAFAELVRRHGPMVLGVCQRVVGMSADAEDAFQAVFVVLARRAGDVRQPELLSHWLYGVAYRVARKARRLATRQRGREVPMANVPEQIERPHEPFPELAGILDEELARLPEWYRLPIVLCDLQGLSRTEAATRLGIPEGTLSSRLANGRKKLADRLTNRGITLAALTLFLTDQVRASVPHRLLDATIETAMTTAFGGTVSTAITQLAYEGIFTMKKLLIVAVAVSMTTVGVVLTTISADDKKTPPVAKVEVKKEGAKEVPQPVKRVEWSKPRMVNYHDLDLAPKKLRWGADQKEPYLFVEMENAKVSGADKTFTNSIWAYRLHDEVVVTCCDPPTGHQFVDVFPNDPALMTARIDSGGINALRELRYLESRSKLADTSRNETFILDTQNRRTRVPNVFQARGNWLDPMQPGKVGPLHIDDIASDHFKLTPDAKGIWNAYHERNDAGEITRIGLRLLHPITGKVEKQLPSVEAIYLNALNYDRECRFAVAHTVTSVKFADDGNTQTMGVTCWNLAKGTIAWNAAIPKDMVPHSVAISADGSVTTIAYQMTEGNKYMAILNDREELKRRNTITRKGKVLSKNEQEEFESKLSPTTVHLFDTATGKKSGEVAFKKEDQRPEITLSPSGQLLLISTTSFNENKSGNKSPYRSSWSKRVRVFDTHTSKIVHQWTGAGLFSFRPTNQNGFPVLAIAETIDKDGPTVSGVAPEKHGRLGLWRFDFSEVEDKK